MASVTAAGATYDALLGEGAVMADGVTGGELAVVMCIRDRGVVLP